MRQVHDGVSDLRDRLEGENNALHGALAQVVQNLRRCLGVVVPEPTPRPLPASRLVYSTKFVCGTHDSLYPFASDLDAAIDLRHRESYSTHVNIHNYGGAPVTIAGQAVQARQIGGTDGKSSEVRRIVMEPGEAVNVDCRDIRQMLYPVTPHEVCVGKTEAIDLLTRLVNSNTDFAYVEQTKLTIEMIEKAVRLEQAGELEEALRLEREIVARLDRLINAVSEETPDSDRVLQTLQDARDLMRRCAVSLAEELGIETDAALDSDALVRPVRFEGFLSISTPAELEVTAVYRAVSVGAASGISIDVEQIQPHRTRAISAQ
jgi:hypothetical protein